MNSPFSSMDAGAAQNAYQFVIDPHVQTAVWAIVLAIACALVLIVAEIVKERNRETAPSKRNHRNDGGG